jgi:phage shock protein PspC (stress-responsive transcriptional regulator)
MLKDTEPTIGYRGEGGDVLSEPKRIFKSRQGRIIDGVCSGTAAYIGIDALWVRIGWALLTLAGGIGILAYLLGMYLFPRAETDSEGPSQQSHRSAGPLVGGLLLIAVGVLLVLRAVGIVNYGFWASWHVAWVILWPLSLIAGGLFLLFVYWRQGSGERPVLKRPASDRMILGVCAGLGSYFRIDPNFIRFLFTLAIILSRGVALVVYIVIALFTPELKDEATP